MDISPSKEEENEDDDEAELNKLLSSLNGMEKCLIPCSSVTDKAIIGRAEKQIVGKTAELDETSDNDVSLKNQAKTTSETASDSTKPRAVSVERIAYDVDNNSFEAISPPVSPTYSNASTLSREPTSGKENDICLNSDEKSKNCALPNNSEPDSKSYDIMQLPQSEGEPSALLAETRDKSKDSDSDSDCLIVEHIAASKHLQNGCIDLTKPTDDEEASFILFNRSEESLVEEIIKIRKALHKHDKKRLEKGKRKKKKRSKFKSRTKSPSLDEVSRSEDETRTIMCTEGGQLGVNIASSDRSNYYCNSRKSLRSPPKTNVSAENRLNQTSVNKGQPESNNVGSETPIPEIIASTEMTDSADSPPLWNSDCENIGVNDKSTKASETNPLKRKLSYQIHTNLSGKPVKVQVFCESSKELKSNFRRENIPKKKHHAEKKASVSGEDNVDSLPSRTSLPDFGISGRLSQNLDRSKSARKTPPSLYGNYRRSRSPSFYRSPNRSSSCYRRRNPSSCRSLTRSSRSKSRHKAASRARDLEYETRSTSRSPRFSHSFRNKSCSFRSESRTYRSPSQARSRRSRSRAYRSPSHSRRSRSRAYRNPSPCRSRRSKSKTYASPSYSRRSKSRTYRSPSRLRRSKSRTCRRPSRSHRRQSTGRRSKSRHRTPRKRSSSRSPSKIREARKCSPLENMRQQLRKNNETAVQQALDGLEKPKNSGVSKACSAHMCIIDEVDLTKSPPSPENVTEPFVMNRNAPPINPHFVRMPIPMAVNGVNPGMLDQMGLLQIGHVYSQVVGLPEHYVPSCPPYPPYM